jgi:hypothetical protein
MHRDGAYPNIDEYGRFNNSNNVRRQQAIRVGLNFYRGDVGGINDMMRNLTASERVNQTRSIARRVSDSVFNYLDGQEYESKDFLTEMKHTVDERMRRDYDVKENKHRYTKDLI